ncbi:hypothetical protein EST38_g1514 [Candolleomyces aberdarensis]|uniref:ADP-ribosylation factor n=1 Tax=Candolleomyces aberdarensis TaxID=2316362 RepID=A0A4Q2DX78_9AGAR|nr:hypothetical protein EST38_g1514 [Candolleomyces aberdarensis]
MTSTLLNLFQRFYPSDIQRVVIAGLSYGGKTTLLYLLKTGDVVTTIPSLGFNVEVVEAPTSSSGSSGSKNPLKMEAWDVGTGCAGSSMIIRMLRFYMPSAKALIWVVDSADKERLTESVETLDGVLADIDCEPDTADRHIPVLILANKSDQSNATPLDKVRLSFSRVLSGRISAIYATSLTANPPTGLPEAFDWLSLAIDIAKTAKKGPRGQLPVIVTSQEKSAAAQSGSKLSPVASQRDPSVLAKRLGEWLQRIESDSPPDEFMQQFKEYRLPSWDHYTHIRLAYLILIAHGRQKGKDILFEGLSNYISNNNTTQTNARTFHVTMTYFWLQVVHFGIRNVPENLAPPHASTAQEASPSQLPYPSSADFFKFLLINPHLVDGSLWSDYYSKETIMSPEAKGSMVLPDKKSLPSLVGREAVSGFGVAKPV